MSLLQQQASAESPSIGYRYHRNMTQTRAYSSDKPFGEAATFPERFFRKPYTKCLGCLASNKIKCENCMQLIAEKLKALAIKSDENEKRAITQALKKRHPHPQRVVYQIRNSFELYLEESMRKRIFPRQKSNYPTKNVNYTLDVYKEPKFQTWKKKSYDRMKDIMYNNLRAGHLGI